MTALSRRDVAAMRLALECLRWHPLPDDDEAAEAIDSAADALRLPRWWFDGHARGVARELPYDLDVPPRILRARLALALRVLLRADAGDFGWPGYEKCDGFEVHECRSCGVRWEAYFSPAYHHGLARKAQYDEMRAHEEQRGHTVAKTRRVRPLWERAPAHDGTTPAMRRQR